MSMDGMVYDVTSYFSKHPGGKNAMLRYCGKDAGAAFYGKPHSDSAKEIRNGFLVGRLTVSGNLTHRDGEVQPAPTAAPEPTEVPTAAPTAVPTIAPTVVPAPDVTPAPTPVDKMITKAEVAQHSVKADCWIIIEKSVYDITNYFAEHPGGDAPVRFCGKDATAVFNRIHDDFAKELREKYRIGALAD
jgi:cytochrome b involved in lipid metabolism